MATSVLGLKTFAASDPVDYNEVNDNYTKIDNGVKTAMQGRAVQNLLVNSDFRIAQAGYGGNHGSKKYACDMWYDTYGFGSFSFNKLQGLTVAYGTNHAYLVQKIEDASRYHGKTMTLAFGLSDGTIRTANGVWLDNAPSFAINFDNGNAILYTNSVDLVVTSGSLTVKWAALYEGSYTADTLPVYQPKENEMAECQRYYRPFINSAPAMSIAATAIEAEMSLEPPMRVVPTITINSVGPAYTPEGTKSVSGSYSATNTVNKAGYVFYTPSIGIGLPCVITGIDGYLSADL